MALSAGSVSTEQNTLDHNAFSRESIASGVSWAAVIAGAVVAIALSLILLSLGIGLGLTAVSPWSGEGASAETMGFSSIAWLIVTQVIALSLGGYLAGRLRTKWSGIHNDEVFFRDTAHGFLVWAVCLVVTTTLMTLAATSVVAGVGKAGGALLSSFDNPVISPKEDVSISIVDRMFRTSDPERVASEAVRSESGRIIGDGMTDLTTADKAYLAELIAANTGLDTAEAEQRIADVITQVRDKEKEAREAADEARKAAAKLTLWAFIGLLVSAFLACIAATIGGRQRDFVRV